MVAMSVEEYNSFCQKRNKMMITLFFVGIFVLLSLRHISVGVDLIEYKYIFQRCSRLSFGQLRSLRWEIGYTVYNKVISLISKEYRFFLIITAFITLIPIYKLYVRETKYGVLQIVLFVNMPCFFMIFSGLRQAIAISIGVIAYMMLERKKYVLTGILIVFAMCFHISAFVLVLLYPALLFKIKKKHLIFVVPMMVVLYIYKTPVLLFLISILPTRYIDSYGVLKNTGAIGMLLLFLLFSVFSFVISDEENMSTKDYLMRNILLISTLFQFFVPIHGLIQRASYYFLIFLPISIINVVQAPKRKLKNISDLAVIVMVCFFSFYFFFNAIYSTDNLLDVFPYKFYWSK